MLLSETKFIFRGIAAALTVILVLPAALFVWMLMAGGVSLGFLSPYLQEALTLRDSPYRVEFDDTILAWNRDDYALDIRAIDLRLVDKGDTVLAILPEVGVSLSLDAMLQGIVAPTRVALRGLHLDLKRDETGGIALAAAKDSVPGAGTGAGALGSWLGELLKEPDPARPTGRLSTVALRGGALSLDDQASGHVWRATNTDIVLNRDAAGIAGTARLVLGLDGAEVPMSADIAYRGTDGTTGLRVGFSALEPGRLAARLPALAGAEAVEMAFSGELRFDLDRDFRPGPIAFAIRGAPGRLVLPAHFTDAVPLRSSEFRGRLARTLDRVEIDEARIETHGPVLTGAGSITSTPRGLALRLRAAANEVRLNDLGRYWPKSFAVNARRWVTTNIRDGQATDGKFTLRLDPGDLAKPRLAKDALEFTFNFSGVSADYFNPMPRIRQARGQARIDAAAFELTLADGTVDALAVSQGRLVIEDLNDPQPLFRSSFSVEGPAARALWLADHEPLALVAEMGFDPAKVAGRSMTRIELRFPISERLTAKQVDVRARARLTGAGIPKLIDDHDLRDGDLQMDVDPRRLEMTGTAVLAEIPLTFRWDETFNPPDGITSRYRVNARPALSRIAALGLPIGDKAKGSVAVDLAVATKGEHLHEAKATVDLTEAEFDLPLPHWRKKAKVPAKATIDAAFPPDAIELRAFGLEGEGMRLGGSASFSRDYAPRRVTITELRQGETEVSGRAEWLADGGLRLALSGKTLDLRPYLRDILAPDDDEPLPNLEMTLRLDRVIVGPQEAVTGLEAEAVHDRDHWKRIAVSAAIGDAPIRVRLDPVPGAPGAGRRKLVVASADAGAFGRVLDLYTNVRGGRLQLEAFIEDALPGEPVVGNLRLEDIRLVDTPVLAKLLTVGSLTGMVDLLRGEGIGFKKFDIPFRLTESRIDMAGAVGAGDALGITIEGTIDRKKETLDLRGTISPAYTINSLLSNLPIIGGLFTARPGEGIIGLNYTVKGPTAEPDVSVSFLSVLTPGFLRNITRLFAPPPPSIAPDGSRPPAPPMGDPGSHNPR